MESKAKVLGHPLHQMLIVFPLGLLIAALVFDALYLFTGRAGFAETAFWNVAGGVVAGLIAAVPGVIDFLAIPSRTRAKFIGAWHGLGNVAVLSLFAIAWVLRLDRPFHSPGAMTLALEVIAVGLGGVTGWLGGELVDRLGVGVDSGAHLNASNSLSHQPADAYAGARRRRTDAVRAEKSPEPVKMAK